MIKRADQIAEALALVKKTRDKNGPCQERIDDETDLEIEYMVACSRLGYTDPEVLEYVKKELLNERQPFREAWGE